MAGVPSGLMVLALDLTPFDLVTRIGFHPAPLVALAVMVAWYWRAVRRLEATGRKWPPMRSLSWGVGILILVVATLSGLTAYDRTSFEVAAVQQLGIFMLAPVLLSLAAPLTLALESSSEQGARRLRQVFMGKVARVVRHPILGWALFAAGTFGLYLSRQYAWALAQPYGLGLVYLELLVIGCLWAWAVLGADPRPVPLAIGWRMLYVLLAVVYYSVLGLAVESQRHRIAPGITVSDLHTGAGIIWSVGVLLAIGASIGVLLQWLQTDEGHARRADRYNAEEDARQLALWRAHRRAAGLADVRASESVIVRSRPAGTERSDAAAMSTVRTTPSRPAAGEIDEGKDS